MFDKWQTQPMANSGYEIPTKFAKKKKSCKNKKK